MLTLQECQLIINRHLNEIKLPGLPANLYEPIRYMLNLEAKRLRPSMVLMACNIFTDNIQPAIYPAMAIEVFHNFTLLHDDIMDQSDLRRNHPTVHVKWSPNVAILSGDAMLIKAYELLGHQLSEQHEAIYTVFNHTALQVCEGQQYDIDFEQSLDVTIKDYLKMIEYKTAVLIAASLKIGALTGGAQVLEADLLYEFGKNIGIAFQLQDDYLDVFADATVFGKVTGNDIVSNKKTILLIEALNKATGNARKELLTWIKSSNFNRSEKIRAVQEIYTSLKIDQAVNHRIQDYYGRATENVEKLNADSEKKISID